jgi:hypothetical protein
MGRILLQRIMNAVVMVVAHVIPKQPKQMPFIQRDHMVQHLAAAASDPAFRRAVLPRTLHARSFRRQPGGREKTDHFVIELRIVIKDRVSVRRRVGQCFS